MNEHQVTYEPQIQKSTDDCGIACLSMLLGIPQATVRESMGARKLKRMEKAKGLTIRQIQAIAKKLGHTLVYRGVTRSDDLTRDMVGIIDLGRYIKDGGGHVAVYLKGCVWTTATGVFWTDLDAYLAYGKFDLEGILVKEGR